MFTPGKRPARGVGENTNDRRHRDATCASGARKPRTPHRSRATNAPGMDPEHSRAGDGSGPLRRAGVRATGGRPSPPPLVAGGYRFRAGRALHRAPAFSSRSPLVLARRHTAGLRVDLLQRRRSRPRVPARKRARAATGPQASGGQVHVQPRAVRAPRLHRRARHPCDRSGGRCRGTADVGRGADRHPDLRTGHRAADRGGDLAVRGDDPSPDDRAHALDGRRGDDEQRELGAVRSDHHGG